MSIEITYRKAVVWLPNWWVLPIIESWSNNCFDFDWRRERSRGIPKKAIWNKKNAFDFVKNILQNYIDDNDDWYDETNRQDMNMQYWWGWRFPWRGDAKSAISYLTNINIDDDITKEIKIFWKNINDIDWEKIEKKGWINSNDISWVENALMLQKQRRENKRRENPKEKKEKKFYICFDSYVYKELYPVRKTRSWLKYTQYRYWKLFFTEWEAKRRAKKYLENMSRIENVKIKKIEN